MKALFYTVGNSDIKVNEYQRFYSFFDTTKELFSKISRFQDYLVFKKGLSVSNKKQVDFTFQIQHKKESKKTEEKLAEIQFPLISALIQYLIIENKKPSKLVLFCTHQEKFHPQDTRYAAELIKIQLIKKYRIENVEIAIIKDNPSDLEKMMLYFNKFINQNYNEIKNNLFNIIQTSAGTPQMYLSLSFALMNMPGLKFYSISRQNEKSVVLENAAFEKINNERHFNSILMLIKNYSYSGAKSIFETSPFRNNQIINWILTILIDKLNFNINDHTLECARNLNATNNPEFDPLIKEVFGLAGSDPKYNFTEFYNQIKVYFERKNYNSALALIFSLFDNLRQLLVEDLLNIKLLMSDGKCRKLEEIIKKNNWESDFSNLNYDNPSKPVLTKILKKFAGQDERVKIFFKYHKKFDEFQNLRNKGPFAHGTAGISEQNIFDKYMGGIPVILNDLKNMLEGIRYFSNETNYKKYNELIEKLMKE